MKTKEKTNEERRDDCQMAVRGKRQPVEDLRGEGMLSPSDPPAFFVYCCCRLPHNPRETRLNTTEEQEDVL